MSPSYEHGGLALLIPAYNAAKYLPRLFSSVKAQTQPFDEIWVYDDCSSDNTSEVAHAFGANVIRGEVNKGCSFGKNTLAAKTGCQWIHFHDADDALFPGFVSAAHTWMEEGRHDVVLFSYEERQEGTDAFIAIRRFDSQDVSRDAVSYSIREQINPFCGLYRRESFLLAGGYDTDPLVLYNEDVAMHCRLAQAGLSFNADDRVLVFNYRRSDSMSSSNQAKCLAAHFQVMKKTAEVVGSQYYHDVARRLWIVVGGAAAHLDWATADEAAKLAMRLSGPGTSPSGFFFKAMCFIRPSLAIRTREALIRLLKPQYRKGYPAWWLRTQPASLDAKGRP
jgi:glycosyltransferase involved in cell wall biosynthesis